MKIRWTTRARQSLKEIRAYIARDSRVNAARMVERITSSVQILRRWPESGSLVEEDEAHQAREVIVGSYRVIYCIVRNEVHIFNVVHAARNLSRRDLPPFNSPE